MTAKGSEIFQRPMAEFTGIADAPDSAQEVLQRSRPVFTDTKAS